MDSGQQLKAYVPAIAANWIEEEPQRRRRSVQGSLVFVDVSGFTALSERLARKGRIGAEELTVVLDRIFTEMLAAAARRGGQLLKFGGDALLLLVQGGDHALQACAAAAEMRSAVRHASEEPTSVGRISLKVSAGVHSGVIDLLLVGDLHRELIVTGPGATVTTQMEAAADAGEIVISDETRALLPSGHAGSRKGPGWLLRKKSFAPPARGSQGAGTGEGVDVSPLIPTVLRDHLEAGSTDSEHRIAGVAFIEFRGVEALSGAGEEDRLVDEVGRLITTIQTAAKGESVTFLGTDVSADGGKVILVTGVPSSLHDDEGRLLRVVRDVIDAPSALSVRAGVNRGHVFAGSVGSPARRTYTVMGDTVNLAARVMTAAPVGSVLATPEILDLSATLFRTEPVEPFSVKGKSQPVAAYSVFEESGVRPPQLSVELPFRGRDPELELLVSIITTCSTVGRGSIMTLQGDTGVGKTRLITEVLGRCTDLATLTVQAEPNGQDNAYWAVRDPLRRMLGIERTTQDDMRRQLRKVVTKRAPQLAAALPLLGDVMQIRVPDTPETEAIDPRFRPERTGAAVVELIETIHPGPFALIAEDAQWLDDASMTLLKRVGTAAESRPWTVILTARLDEPGFAPQGDAMILHPLDEEAVRQIVIEATQAAPLRPHELEAVVSRSGGSPLFLGEILRVMRETGDASALPESLDAVVSVEIDTLPPLSRKLLRYSSVLGRSFRRVVLDEFLAPEEIDLDEATIKDLRRFLVSDVEDRLQFRHLVVHDVAYEGLSFRRRRQLHQRAGEVIERLAGADPDAVAEYLAGHYALAGDHDKVWRYARVAGDRARRAYSNVEAATQYRRAVDAASHVGAAPTGEVADVLARMGDAQELSGRLEEARESFGRAIRLTRDDPVRNADLHLLKARTWLQSGRLSQAARNITLGRKLLEPDGDLGHRRALARLQAYDSNIRAARGDPVAALGVARAAAEMAARSGEDEALARAYGVIDWANFMLGNDEPRHGNESIAIYERLGQVERSGNVKNNMGAFAFLEGKWSEAAAWYGEAVEAAERSGNVVAAAGTMANLAEVLVEQRRYAEAIPHLDEAARVYIASKASHGLPFVRMVRARALTGMGDLDVAISELEDLFATQMEAGETSEDPQIVVHLATALVAAGRPEDALARLSLFRETAPDDAAEVAVAMSRVEAIARGRLGDHEHAADLLRECARQAADDEDPGEELRALEALMAVTRDSGGDPDPDDAAHVEALVERLDVMAAEPA